SFSLNSSSGSGESKRNGNRFSSTLLGNLMIVTPSEVDVIRLWFFGNISTLRQAEYGRGRPKNEV
ncbi:MAG: hypothetical protein VYE67_05320, partial [Planctomycetota bacterium]|nr:hypothetical protein [Planctomycetota bacterium]